VALSLLASLFPKSSTFTPQVLIKKPARLAPLQIGLLFSGGPASGGHNVACGLFDALAPGSSLIGFLGGPQGLIDNKRKALSKNELDLFRNTGGFDLLGTGRTKIETAEQIDRVAHHLKDLDGLLIVGGDDSQTNAAHLAEKLNTPILGVPKTIDGDLRGPEIELSFGFDTAATTYSELIGNLGCDALSDKKYWHIVKLMGRSASHLTLECALRTRPNFTLIAEERKSLSAWVDELASLIAKRSYGLVVFPEGLLEFVSDLSSCPLPFLNQLQEGTDPHGNLPLSQIKTEELLIAMVKERGVSFKPVPHFYGYEGRSAFPTPFDAHYGYALGRLAAIAFRDRLTGQLLTLQNLKGRVEEWVPKAVPLYSLLHFEERKGIKKPVIAKTVVSLKSPSYRTLAADRSKWAVADHYLNPGPCQFSSLERRPFTLDR
jgi:pyrophosphate--fructose-6-phosphate 1-phosphotransferase